jgi:hypothetical protein
MAALLCACAKEIDDGGSSKVDFSNPKTVLASVFHAARTGDADHLESLCDPQGEGNEHTKRICRVRKGGPDWDSFRKNFRAGRLNGEPRITDDIAVVMFIYGPKGKQTETMKLVRRGDKWFLHSF